MSLIEDMDAQGITKSTLGETSPVQKWLFKRFPGYAVVHRPRREYSIFAPGKMHPSYIIHRNNQLKTWEITIHTMGHTPQGLDRKYTSLGYFKSYKHAGRYLATYLLIKGETP